jgi:hypothetical protein
VAWNIRNYRYVGDVSTSPTAAEEEEDEDVSSPAKDAEKETPADAKKVDANVETSPAKEK